MARELVVPWSRARMAFTAGRVTPFHTRALPRPPQSAGNGPERIHELRQQDEPQRSVRSLRRVHENGQADQREMSANPGPPARSNVQGLIMRGYTHPYSTHMLFKFPGRA